MVGAATAQTITTVMSGLDAPRGLAMGPEGGLYVTEAGSDPIVSSVPCTPVAMGSNCYSETGKDHPALPWCPGARGPLACRPSTTPHAWISWDPTIFHSRDAAAAT